eukprot:523755-Amphidinium_carterae.1
MSLRLMTDTSAGGTDMSIVFQYAAVQNGQDMLDLDTTERGQYVRVTSCEDLLLSTCGKAQLPPHDRLKCKGELGLVLNLDQIDELAWLAFKSRRCQGWFPLACLQDAGRTLYSDVTSLPQLDIEDFCQNGIISFAQSQWSSVPMTQNSIDRHSLTYAEAVLLMQCGSFWPDFLMDEYSFMKLLLRVLNVEAGTDIHIDGWWMEGVRSSSWNLLRIFDGDHADVDVSKFVSFCMLQGVGGLDGVLGVLYRPQRGDERLAATSSTLLQGAARGVTRSMINIDKSLTLSSLSTAVIGEQTPLPSPEAQAGAVVVVNSKQYVLGEKLGRGAGGSVFAATLEAADAHLVGDEKSDSHDP